MQPSADAKRHHLPSRLTALNLLADAVLQLEAVDVQRLLLLHQHPWWLHQHADVVVEPSVDVKRRLLPSRLTGLNLLAAAEAPVVVAVSHASCSPVSQNQRVVVEAVGATVVVPVTFQHRIQVLLRLLEADVGLG